MAGDDPVLPRRGDCRGGRAGPLGCGTSDSALLRGSRNIDARGLVPLAPRRGRRADCRLHRGCFVGGVPARAYGEDPVQRAENSPCCGRPTRTDLSRRSPMELMVPSLGFGATSLAFPEPDIDALEEGLTYVTP